MIHFTQMLQRTKLDINEESLPEGDYCFAPMAMRPSAYKVANAGSDGNIAAVFTTSITCCVPLILIERHDKSISRISMIHLAGALI